MPEFCRHFRKLDFGQGRRPAPQLYSQAQAAQTTGACENRLLIPADHPPGRSADPAAAVFR